MSLMPKLWITLPRKSRDEEDLEVAPVDDDALEVSYLDYTQGDEPARETVRVNAGNWGWDE